MANKTALPQLDGFSNFIRQTMADWNVPGLAIAVVKDGEVVLCEGFGQRSVAQNLPVTPDTLFAIGSTTKAFTATSLGILVDEGKLRWDTPVKSYLPTFKMHDPFATERMTPRDLLCHRSGLPRHDLMWYGSSFSRKELFDRLQYLEPSKDFRTNFQYQNLMFMAAGYLAGEVSGLSWEGLVRQRILNPLGMKTTNFSVEDSQKASDFALPYMDKDGQLLEIPFRNITELGAAGSINSSVREMIPWLLLQLNKGKHGDQQIISEATLKQIHTPQMVVDDPVRHEMVQSEDITYGLGWLILTNRGNKLVYHTGGIDGFSSTVSFMPSQNAAAVVLTNMGGTYVPMVVMFTLYDRLRQLDDMGWNRRYQTVNANQEAATKAEHDQSETERIKDTQPSHPLDAYVGDYEHPGYGVFSIVKHGDQLGARYNNRDWLMKHYHYDVFEAIIERDDMRVKLVFSADLKGGIDGFSAQLEPMVKPIVFTRLPDKSMQDPAFLQPFVGNYDLAGKPLTVTRKGHTLIVSFPGQQNVELIPYRGTTFQIKGQSGWLIEFQKDDQGEVTGASVTQVGGIVKAMKQGL